MSNPNDGSPDPTQFPDLAAFGRLMDNGGPVSPLRLKNNLVEFTYPGLNLRDYFAAKALAGFSAVMPDDDNPLNWEWPDIAKAAYMAADAMLAARSTEATP